MVEAQGRTPNEWVFFAGIIFLAMGSLAVALLHGPLQLLAAPAFAISAVCAFVYGRSVITWKPARRR